MDNDRLKKDLLDNLYESQREILNLFAIYDCMFFASSYLETKEFEEEAKLLGHDKTLLHIGIVRTNQYVYDKILTKINLVNRIRSYLKMRLIDTSLDNLYYQMYAIVVGDFDKEDFDPSLYTAEAAKEAQKKLQQFRSINLNLTDDDEDPTIH